MKARVPKNISVLEFRHPAPLKFFEHCSKCARFGDDCPDLTLGKEVLQGKKKVAYGDDVSRESIHMSAFNCLAPLYYIERRRRKCAYAGKGSYWPYWMVKGFWITHVKRLSNFLGWGVDKGRPRKSHKPL